WQYQGAFKPPFDSDSMEDVIVYADEIRLTFTSHWYPKPLWSSRHAIRPSSRLAVQVPEGFMVVSGGRQQHPPLRRDGQVLYRYASTTNGSLSFAAARYAKTSIPWGDKTLEAYFFPKKPGEKPKLIVTKLPQQEKNVLETLKIAQNILDFYCRQFAPYPWGSFALVQKSKHAAYAYGVQSYVVMNKLTRVHEKTLAHEIAHQWWGNLVDPAGPGERWLTESLAEYSAFLYMEHAHASKKVVGDRREFLLSQMLNMHPIRETSFGTPGYENIIYHIGPHVFHMLRYVVGDEQFSDIMKTFTEEYANKNATVDDFIRVAERVHKESLAWFFDEWLGRTRNPAFVLESEVTKHAGNTFLVEGTISQHNTDYRMPLEIQIVGKRRKEKQRIWVEGSKTAFEYVVRHEPSEVKFAEEMAFWVLADFFHSEDERLAVSEKRPKPPPARTRNELFDIIRSKITVGRPYKLGTEIKLELEAEQAARLDCAENPYGYKEILICPLEGILYNYTFYTDLRSSGSGGGKRLASGYDHRGRSMEVRNISAWEIKDDKVHIRFRAETDKEKIKQEFREKYRKKGMTPKEIDERLAELFPQ
ncbi:MAG: M1 family metallopeptidase, partial [Planctomycetota bacterium]